MHPLTLAIAALVFLALVKLAGFLARRSARRTSTSPPLRIRPPAQACTAALITLGRIQGRVEAAARELEAEMGPEALR